MTNSIVLQTRSVVHPFDMQWHTNITWTSDAIDDATWRMTFVCRAIFIVCRTISIFLEQYNLPYFNTMPRRRGELHTLFVNNRVDHIVMQCHVAGGGPSVYIWGPAKRHCNKIWQILLFYKQGV
jgi:hypothetical protein